MDSQKEDVPSSAFERVSGTMGDIFWYHILEMITYSKEVPEMQRGRTVKIGMPASEHNHNLIKRSESLNCDPLADF